MNPRQTERNVAQLITLITAIHKDKTFFTAEDAEDAEEKHEGFPLRPLR